MDRLTVTSFRGLVFAVLKLVTVSWSNLTSFRCKVFGCGFWEGCPFGAVPFRRPLRGLLDFASALRASLNGVPGCG